MSSTHLRIAFLTTVLPRERRMGSEVASQAIVDALRSRGHIVEVVGYTRRDARTAEAPGEISIGPRAIETRRSRAHAMGWMASAFARNLPYSAAKFRSESYLERVGSLMAGGHHDVVVIDHSQLAWLLRAALRGNAPLITVAHNVEHETYAERANRERGPTSWIYRRESRLLERCERTLARHAKEIWVFTAHDASFYRTIDGHGQLRVLSLPSNLNLDGHGSVDKEFDIALIGSWSWKPNAEGLRWFLTEIYPRLPNEVSIQIAGSGANWLANRYPNVAYRGFVPDSRRFLMQARAVAIPTLSGGGIQLKTLDAIAAGSRVIGTTLAGRGILDAPASLTLTDQPDRFVFELLKAITAGDSVPLRKQAFDWTRRREQRFCEELDESVRAVACTPDSVS